MQSGRRKLLIIGGVVVGVLLIAAVSTTLLNKQSNSPDGVCRRLFSYVTKRDATNSYAMLSSDLQSATSKSVWSDTIGVQAALFSNPTFKLSSQQNLSQGTDSSGNPVTADKAKPVRWLMEYTLSSPAASATVNCTVSAGSKTTTIDGFDVIPTAKGNQ